MSSPLVSVIVPVHNGARFLGEALRSIREQTYPTVEIIVVDDGSTDGSAEIARSAGARLIRQPRRGVAAARNAGIAAATGDLLAFLDQDDLWVRTKLARQVEVLLADPGLLYVLARDQFFVVDAVEPPAWFRLRRLDQSYVAFEAGAILARRRAFEVVGLFDTAYAITPDSDWFFRAKDLGAAMAVVDEVLLHRRLHRNNLSHLTERSTAEIRRVALASIRRQRARAAAADGMPGTSAGEGDPNPAGGKEPVRS
jgi:glycosyltransferase involved in cell wall biosynthesis